MILCIICNIQSIVVSQYDSTEVLSVYVNNRMILTGSS